MAAFDPNFVYKGPNEYEHQDVDLIVRMTRLFKTRICPRLGKNLCRLTSAECFDSHEEIPERKPPSYDFLNKQWEKTYTEPFSVYHPLFYMTKKCPHAESQKDCNKGPLCPYYHGDEIARNVINGFVDDIPLTYSMQEHPPKLFKEWNKTLLERESQSSVNSITSFQDDRALNPEPIEWKNHNLLRFEPNIMSQEYLKTQNYCGMYYEKPREFQPPSGKKKKNRKKSKPKKVEQEWYKKKTPGFDQKVEEIRTSVKRRRTRKAKKQEKKLKEIQMLESLSQVTSEELSLENNPKNLVVPRIGISLVEETKENEKVHDSDLSNSQKNLVRFMIEKVQEFQKEQLELFVREKEQSRREKRFLCKVENELKQLCSRIEKEKRKFADMKQEWEHNQIVIQYRYHKRMAQQFELALELAAEEKRLAKKHSNSVKSSELTKQV